MRGRARVRTALTVAPLQAAPALESGAAKDDPCQPSLWPGSPAASALSSAKGGDTIVSRRRPLRIRAAHQRLREQRDDPRREPPRRAIRPPVFGASNLTFDGINFYRRQRLHRSRHRQSIAKLWRTSDRQSKDPRAPTKYEGHYGLLFRSSTTSPRGNDIHDAISGIVIFGTTARRSRPTRSTTSAWT